jgi:hypothetical protein
MDGKALLCHRDHWSTESISADHPLAHLTNAQRSLYRHVISDAHCRGAGLEQERVRL